MISDQDYRDDEMRAEGEIMDREAANTFEDFDDSDALREQREAEHDDWVRDNHPENLTD